MEEWQEKYKQILNGDEPDAAEQKLTAAKDEATKAADNQNENINKLKAELANSKGSHQTMLSQNKTMKENLQTKEKELDFWIEEYNKQLEEKSIEGKDSEEEGIEERSIEPSLIDRNIIREMLHSAEDWNAIRRETKPRASRSDEIVPRPAPCATVKVVSSVEGPACSNPAPPGTAG